MNSLQNLCPPPRRFRPARDITSAEFSLPPSFVIPSRSRSRARADGVRYEKRAHKYLEEAHPLGCVLAPWIKFTSGICPEPLWCQPDTLILDLRRNTITVVEIKLKHTSDAWWQVRRLYTPVVKYIFGEDWTYLAIEVAKWFDPHTKFPERFEFVDDISSITSLSPDKFYVHLWNGRKT